MAGEAGAAGLVNGHGVPVCQHAREINFRPLGRRSPVLSKSVARWRDSRDARCGACPRLWPTLVEIYHFQKWHKGLPRIRVNTRLH